MKKLCSLIISILLSTSSTLLPDNLNQQAQNYNPIQNKYSSYNFIQDNDSSYQGNEKILNFDDVLRQAVYYNYLYDYSWTHPSYIWLNTSLKNLTQNNKTVSPIGDTTIKNLPYGVYFGTSILQNNSDVDQTFTLPSFTKKVESEYTTEVKKGITGSIGFDFQYGNIKISGNLSSDHKETNKSSTTITSPNQDVMVKPHQTIKASVYLGLGVGNIDLNVSEDISGSVSARVRDSNTGVWNYTTTVGKAFAAMVAYHTLPSTIKILDDNTIRFTGLVSISAEAVDSTFSVKYENV